VDRRLIARLCEDIGDGLYPFRDLAEELGLAEEELLARMHGYRADGRLRRFGAMLRHQSAGFTANGMSVWDVPDADVARVGAILADFPEVSHAYERPRFPGWPYNVFGMIHARTEDECRAVAARIAEAIGIDASHLLFSLREFKKTSMRYLG
jgi:DNA-binding Lrp family transcriptional regulator